ncbi:aldolase/citrate lyase family protein [Actinomadura viridis]|uniref:4-hydroxy-2-oxoheptanedioate aldolase n=1 Tax=Actinomadura viridis TaxID=58110 RepID=A0A931DN85_9ACTN|nr:aldolase/citrate lyase family protein [Actinomadura viridis]MBG6091062.1 4-hydroxy-2-oxoheptanedioate aldolase [Actinomadura viridis]
MTGSGILPGPHLDRLAARLRSGAAVTGVVLKMPGAALVELAGHVGFDLVVLDTEHGPAGGELLENHVRAADSAGVPVVVRVSSNRPEQILHALDAGAAGVIVPHVDTADQAAAAVRAAHYPPHGSRGFALSTRAGRHGAARTDRHIRDAERTLVIAQIEDVAAIPHVAEIAATPRLDAVWVGPGDLSLSVGRPGDLDHPDVTAAIDRIVTDAQGARNAKLCVIVRDEREARSWRSRGAAIVLYNAIDVIRTSLTSLASGTDAEAGPPPARRPLDKTREQEHR